MDKFLIKHPIITEKASRLGADRKYVFLVAAEASAPEIRKLMKAIYKVDVIRANTINVKPKNRRLGRSTGVKPGYKKMIVTLKEGQTLDVLPH